MLPIQISYLPLNNYCMLCDNPTGPVCILYVNKLCGYCSCLACQEKMEEIKYEWMRKTGFEHVHHLFHKNLKVGQNDWVIDVEKLMTTEVIKFGFELNQLYIPCIYKVPATKITISRYILLSELLYSNVELLT